LIAEVPPMPRLRCPMCRMKFNTSKTEGRVRCPECEELFEPDWEDAEDDKPRKRDRDDDNRDDEPRRKPIVKNRRRQKSGSSGGALLVAGLVLGLLFLVAIGVAVYFAFGRSSSFTTFSPPGGRCSILMPGKPDSHDQKMLGMDLKVWMVEKSNSAWTVSWTDVPPGMPFDLRGVADGVANMMGGQVKSSELKGDPRSNGFVEYEVSITKPRNGYASGRAMLVNGRFYHFFAVGSSTRLSNDDVRKFIDSFKLTDGDFPWDSAPQAKGNNNPGPKPNPGPIPKKNPPKGDGWAPDPKAVDVAREEVLGVDFDPKQTDTAPAGAILVGLEVGLAPFFDYNIVGTLKPIYRKGKTDSTGQHYGMDEKNGVVKLLAKPGYAVGAITAKTGLGIDGVSVTFMKIDGDRLDPSDAYESAWVGGMGGGGPRKVTGEGAPATGLIVREGRERVSAVGLVFKK
jgi:hypothetical protein